MPPVVTVHPSGDTTAHATNSPPGAPPTQPDT